MPAFTWSPGLPPGSTDSHLITWTSTGSHLVSAGLHPTDHHPVWLVPLLPSFTIKTFQALKMELGAGDEETNQRYSLVPLALVFPGFHLPCGRPWVLPSYLSLMLLPRIFLVLVRKSLVWTSGLLFSPVHLSCVDAPSFTCPWFLPPTASGSCPSRANNNRERWPVESRRPKTSEAQNQQPLNRQN